MPLLLSACDPGPMGDLHYQIDSDLSLQLKASLAIVESYQPTMFAKSDGHVLLEAPPTHVH